MSGLAPGQLAPIATTTRSGFDESVHFGAVAAYDASGELVLAVGDPHAEVFPRSSNKPLQALAMLELGWSPTAEQLALACASHAGTPVHLAVVESTLADVGLTPDDLANTPTLPLDHAAIADVLRAGGEPSSLLQNCSGKHAAMLATCVVNGWPTEGYLAEDHPVQAVITRRYGELTGQVPDDVFVGIDGCGAPTHATPLSGLARSFATIAAAQGPVWQAMTAHPELVDGAGRTTTRIMQAVPGLMAKGGAEGMFAAALPDGRCVAVKIADGAARAAGVVCAAALAAIGVEIDPEAIAEPILGHGRPVGTIRVGGWTAVHS